MYICMFIGAIIFLCKQLVRSCKYSIADVRCHNSEKLGKQRERLEIGLVNYIPALYSAITNVLGGVSWWRHQMEICSALLAICAGNSPVPGEFPAQRPVTRSFDVFFDLRLKKTVE